ncbi:MAG: proton-conducting transporter membrane subunit [Actinomycetota bacterium]|nr:proton-conducting transporter membrane subunit [Actinomycetota bacterium]
MIRAGLLAQLAFMIMAIALAVLVPARYRARVTGLAVAGIGLAGCVTGVLALTGDQGLVEIPVALPFGPLTLSPTPLGGFFMLVIGAVGAITAVYAIGYVHGPSASRTSWIALAVFMMSMQLVAAAADVVSFLLFWELMAAASTILVLTEHALRPAVRPAAIWYAAMTQLSFFLLLIGFAVLAAQAGSTQFSAFSTTPLNSTSANIAFVCLLLGFASKAGTVPLHVWLPRAHPEAPSHISALMSAAMVKLGVYGAILVSTRFLVSSTTWWSLLILALGLVSAVYGILQASVASDLKRLLAYSTTENIGLMFLAIGSASLLRSYGTTGVADIALAGCLLLVMAHAAFKTTLFLGAGSMLRSTGERDLDRLGGLGSRMPMTSVAFGIGALGAAALPLTVGFVAEWVLLQSLIHGAGGSNRILAIVMPVTVGAVALTAGLALMTFVKAYGIAFLARPRSQGADDARESPFSMRVGMGAAAFLVIALGLAPGMTASAAAAAGGLVGIGSVGLFGIDVPGIGALLDPAWLSILGAVLVVPVLLVSLHYARRRPRRKVDLAWGGGGVRVNPRMQYTATSYAEPLARIFDDSLRPERDVIVTHSSEAQYLVERIQYRQRLSDVFETRLYLPVIELTGRMTTAARHLQNGKIHFYLAYSFIAFLLVLLVVTL